MSNREPVAVGKWGDTVTWEIHQSDELPPTELCTAIACVALTGANLDEVVLTRNKRGWEVLAGHIENGETLEQALEREALEEGGFRIARSIPFGYRKITATKRAEPGTRQASYPYPTSYIAYSLGYTDSPIEQFTGDEIIESRAFTSQERDILVQSGELDELEQTIINLGIEVSQRQQL
jgi:8-oxo-dGTP pyrophosphatase MutT (NUDIX family)